MSLRETFRPVFDAFRGDQFRPTVILLTSPLLMLLWKYFGSPECGEYWLEHYVPQLALGHDPAAAGAVYSFLTCFLLLGVVPALMVKFLFGQRLSDYGVQLGDGKRGLQSCLTLVPLLVLVAYLSSGDASIRAEYPVNKSAGLSPGVFGFHALTYAMFYLGWEFHFRGFLQFGLRDKLGTANALLIQVMASGLLHIGKPGMESFAAIGGGVLWGIVALRTRSLAAGIIQHFLLGITLDWFICYA